MAGVFLGAADADAQAPQTRGFAAITFGSQTLHTLQTSSEFDVLGRRGTVRTLRHATSAPLVDVAGALTIRRPFAIGVGVLSTRSTQLLSFDASVPVARGSIPIFPDRDILSISDVLKDAEHRETQVHVSGFWVAPLNDKVTIDFNAGPSVFFVKHDSIAAMTLTPPLFAKAVVTKDSATAMGYHTGFDLRARLVKHAGVAFGIRYAHATASLSTGTHPVGGLQVRAGLAAVF